MRFFQCVVLDGVLYRRCGDRLIEQTMSCGNHYDKPNGGVLTDAILPTTTRFLGMWRPPAPDVEGFMIAEWQRGASDVPQYRTFKPEER